MTERMNISSWTNHISGEISDPNKFAKVIEDLQNVALQDAISSLGLSDKEYLCIKELSVPVKIDLSRSIRSISRQWSKEFKSQLEQKHQLNDASVIYYRSMHQAHIACAKGVLTNNTQELWAWRQSGVLMLSDTSTNSAQTLLDKWSDASIERGCYQIALWQYLLQSPLLIFVLKRFNEQHWKQHFSGLEAALDSSLQVLSSSLSKQLNSAFENQQNSVETLQKDIPDSASGTDRRTPASMRVSALMRAPAFIKALNVASISQRESLICFAIALSEPALINLPKAEIEQRLNKILAALKAQPNLNFDIFCAQEAESNDPSKAQNLDDYTNKETLVEGRDKLNNHEQSKTITDQPNDIVTPFGGIFWLYNVLVANPSLLEDLVSDRRFSNHTHTWIWCWLARQLLPEPNFDLPLDSRFRTAIATFAGITDMDEFDQLIAQQPELEQQLLLTELSDKIKSRFLDQIEQVGGNRAMDYHLLIRRNAKIEREGPWLEIEFSLNDVDVDVRRAGLDANPDFINWLGMVVRFVYA